MVQGACLEEQLDQGATVEEVISQEVWILLADCTLAPLQHFFLQQVQVSVLFVQVVRLTGLLSSKLMGAAEAADVQVCHQSVAVRGRFAMLQGLH